MAEEVLAEIGTDMSRFPTANHWHHGLDSVPATTRAPASAGVAAADTTASGCTQLSLRLPGLPVAPRTPTFQLNTAGSLHAVDKGALIVAVAHTIIVAIYHMLRKGTRYRDVGRNYFTKRARHFHLDRAVRHIESLGYRVSLQSA